MTYIISVDIYAMWGILIVSLGSTSHVFMK